MSLGEEYGITDAGLLALPSRKAVDSFRDGPAWLDQRLRPSCMVLPFIVMIDKQWFRIATICLQKRSASSWVYETGGLTSSSHLKPCSV